MSTPPTTTPVNVRILDKEYYFSCSQEERADLIQSAEFLNSKMREIRDSGKIIGLDRIAVMAALNLANELLKSRGRDPLAGDVGVRIRNMRERVEAVLAKGHQLEL
jgi:cell division protein ZapA